MATWENLIAIEMRDQEESWEDVKGHTLSIEQLREDFNPGYGRSMGVPFTL